VSSGNTNPEPTIDELDEPVLALGDGTRGEAVFRSRAPAAFDRMTPEQREGWPRRAAVRWMRRRAWLVVMPIAVGVGLQLAGRPWPSAVAAAGLVLDIIGVWLLAEGLLLSDDDAAYLSTMGALGRRHLLARRDRYQTQFALVIVTLGFVGQIAPLLFT